ncbi:MAG: hypothetical protein DRJ26_03070 [Candidatus Methanomethylicota archaeon]|uniref:Uncharacterized protein n=1 Tax=Thermoproteota archaeon TaxID=2056631 RepID=A0A497F2Z2_9CREN|nr:MAG: hypothetical protein DRJ26_03070 [Candidatus Verstraetearchaeota archaeon]
MTGMSGYDFKVDLHTINHICEEPREYSTLIFVKKQVFTLERLRLLDVIEYIHRIRGKLEKFNKNIYNGFNAIFNALTLTREFLNYYYSRWASYDVSKLSLDEVERLRKEDAERVIEITKRAFLHAMSIIEFSVKGAVE